ncbi:transmembrane protein 182-like [Scyliorhinus canicula]|uniref:transmembrane protein 182-like n=1 Tax=Scyliorhinus canicula TaxID=7830 RepID=UPI0018F2CE30|nr:transmembrane protein 182-like [Scyliorhinus canicula]
MQQLTVTLSFARLSAAIGLLLFFLTSCTNYWLHAITYPRVNGTEVAEVRSNSTGPNQEHFNGKENSTGVNQPVPTTEPVVRERQQIAVQNRELPNWDINFFCCSNSTASNREHFKGKGISTVMNQPVVRKKRYAPGRELHNWDLPLFMRQLSVTYHHEGFFWRCWFTDKWIESSITKFIFINQPPTKCCIHASSSPFPSTKEKPSSKFESLIVYRRLWSALMIVAVIFITIGCVFITFKAFCKNYRRYKVVGAIFLLSGALYTLSIIMYACWISAVRQIITEHQMIMQDNIDVHIVKSEVKYGWSFMAAPVAAVFSLIAGSRWQNWHPLYSMDCFRGTRYQKWRPFHFIDCSRGYWKPLIKLASYVIC